MFRVPAVASFTIWATCRAVKILDNTGTGLVQVATDASRRADDEPAPIVTTDEEPALTVNDRKLWPKKTKKFALVISATGMDSHYGSGVRQMAFSMDLEGCDFGTDTLTEKPQDTLDWRSVPAMGLIAGSTNFNVGVGGNRSGFTASRVKSLMHRYDRIYLFGWAWETEYAHTLETALQALESDPRLQGRVTLVLDDNPYHRCYAEHKLDYCRERAPTMLRRWLNVSSRAMSISARDAAELNRLKASEEIPGPSFETWPLSLEQVGNLFNRSNLPKTVEGESETYLTMVANDHAENRRFVSELVTGGHLEQICSLRSIGARALKVCFVGSIARYIQMTYPREVSRLQRYCLRLKYEISTQQLEEKIFPMTVAILNPFLETVNSGISVKTFESVAMGMPIVTSMAGFRGLEECGTRLDQAGLLATNTAAGYVDVIKNKLVNPETSLAFTAMQQQIMRTCVAEQKREVDRTLCSKTE
jgi:hypothetical protein